MSFSHIYQCISWFVMFALLYAICMGIGWILFRLLNGKERR